MKIKKELIIPFLASILILSACGTTSSSTSLDSNSSISDITSNSSNEYSQTTSSSSEDGNDFVGEPIKEGKIPDFLDVYFHIDSLAFNNYAIWIWDEAGNAGKEYSWTEISGDWAKYRIDLTSDLFEVTNGIYFLFKGKSNWGWQTPDTYFKFSDWGHVNGVVSTYATVGKGNVIELFNKAENALGDQIKDAILKDFKTIELNATQTPSTWDLYINDLKVNSFKPSGELKLIKEATENSEAKYNYTDTIVIDHDANLHHKYEIRTTFASKANKEKIRGVSFDGIFKSKKFNDLYTYDGDDLGVVYEHGVATFKLWAPTSRRVDLNLYHTSEPSVISGSIYGDMPIRSYQMLLGDKGVWSYSIKDRELTSVSLEGIYYTYRVVNSNGIFEVVDPYAKSAGTNGVRGQVLNLEKYQSSTFNDLKLPSIKSASDLIVYEMQVSDLTNDETWTGSEINRGKYAGVVEKGTTYTSGSTTVKTGYDHIKELGINAIQIMPFYDQDNNDLSTKHNWGYNPLNFNVLEGQYSSNPSDGRVRVREFKDMVETFANDGIRVVMDVVYNHVSAASSSNFNRIVPGYYFRYNSDGTYNNDAGVGNVFASEMPMATKFIVDSTVHWATNYNIKGFRFDLMALISDWDEEAQALNHDTLIKVSEALAKIDDEIVVWGEPWGGFTRYDQGMQYKGGLENTTLAAFNDRGRNGLKGDNNIKGNGHYGFINSGPTDIQREYGRLNNTKGMLAGIVGDYYDTNNFLSTPAKNVNYAGAHDNFTLFDQMRFSGFKDEKEIMRAQTAANMIVLTSQGIPFFQGGDEIGRTKPFDHTTKAAIEFMHTHENEYAVLDGVYYSGNSYNIGAEVNSYKWDDKIKHLEYFNTYKNMIDLRLNKPQGASMRLSSSLEVKQNFSFWDSPLISWAAIATQNTFLTNDGNVVGSGAIYSLYTGRLVDSNNKVDEQLFDWGGGNLIVLFDSENILKQGSLVSDKLTLESHRVVIVQRP